MSLFGQNQPSTGSLFGQNNQNQQKPNLFGSLNTSTSQSQQGGGLFGSTNSSQPQQSGGLFGQANTSQQQQSGGLFGSSQPQQQQSSNIFGGGNQQQQSSSLFNNNPQQQAGGGLFGQSSQPQQTSSLFSGGLGQNQNQQSQQQGGGLFGGANTQQQKPSLSLFGGTNTQNQQQQQQQRPSLFSNPSGSQAPQQQGSLFNNATLPTLGASQAQQQTVPGVKIDVSNLRGTTRFNDLHEELQKQIEQMDNFIQQQIAFKDQCDALMPAHGSNLETLPNDVKVMSNMVHAVELSMDNDTRDINAIKDLVTKDVENAKLSFRAIENLKLPQQFHYSGMYYGTSTSQSGALNSTDDGEKGPVDLVSYFSSTASDLSKTLDTYKTQLAEIEDHMRMVEGNAIVQSQEMAFKKGADGGERSQSDQIQELSAVLNSFWNSINGVAEKVGGARHDVQQYTLNSRRR